MRAYDSEPEKIQRYAGMRDEFTGDMMGINFDSYHDHRTGFEFDLTAYGQKDRPGTDQSYELGCQLESGMERQGRF